MPVTRGLLPFLFAGLSGCATAGPQAIATPASSPSPGGLRARSAAPASEATTSEPVLAASPVQAAPSEAASSAGGLAELGADEAGSGSGSGAGPTAPTAPEASVAAGQAEVNGAIDADIIRRVVRYHTGEVKFCYERQLVKNPDLAGKLVVRFVIDGDGSVAEASSVSSTLGDSELESCILHSVRAWQFPAPVGGGRVTVGSYPFVFDHR